MRRMVSALLMTATLATPMVVSTNAFAGTPPASVNVTVRVYDPYRRDYHVWDRQEDRAYREYLATRHRAYISYERQRVEERRAYWRWRHEREERIEHERR